MSMISVLILYIVLSAVMFLLTIGDIDNICSSPLQVYERNKLNFLGCVGIYIVGVITNPLLFVTKFIRWVVRKGRREQ